MRGRLRVSRNAGRVPSGRCVTAVVSLGGAQRGEHGFGVSCPRVGSCGELSSTSCREGVVLRSAIGLGEPPLARDAFLFLESVQCVVERAFFDLECAVRGVFDPSRDGVAVAWSPGECLEDEDVEGAFEEVEGVVAHGRSGWRIGRLH